jgi:hypothetical protein
MTTENKYPLLAKHHTNYSSLYSASWLSNTQRQMIEGISCPNYTAEEEIAIFTELLRYQDEEYIALKKKVQGKLLLHKYRDFDIESVKKLPDDILFEIKSYLEPEITKSRKLGVLLLYKQINMDGFCFKLSKKQLMELFRNSIGYTALRSGAQKEVWCNYLHEALRDDQPNKRDTFTQLNTRPVWCGEKRQDNGINNYYKLLLHIVCFIKHRTMLEKNKKKNEAKIKTLKNTEIRVKNIIYP